MAQGTDGAIDGAEGASPPVPAAGDFGHGAGAPINAVIEKLTRWLALVGGALMMVAIVLTIVSVVGRYALDAPVPGDYEIVELICGVGIFLFFPYTHATNANIVVEFFSLGFPRRTQRMLDIIHDAVFAAVAALMTWRLFLGLSAKYIDGDSTALVRIPLWWSYSFAVTSMALLCLVCVARILAGLRALPR